MTLDHETGVRLPHPQRGQPICITASALDLDSGREGSTPSWATIIRVYFSWSEFRIWDAEVAGSSPATLTFAGTSRADFPRRRQKCFSQCSRSSNWIEQLNTNQKVAGSSPAESTNFFHFPDKLYSGCPV